MKKRAPKKVPTKAPARKPVKAPVKKQGGTISYGELRRREIEAMERDIFLEVLHPKENSVLRGVETDEALCDPLFWKEEPLLSSSSVIQKAVTRLSKMANAGDRDAIGALANEASTIIHFLNELADGEGEGVTEIKGLAAGSRFWPQLLGKHPDVLKESKMRMKNIGLGSNVNIKQGFSDLPTKAQPWRAIFGGYTQRLSTAIRWVWLNRETWERDVEKGVKLPAWMNEALELPEEESKWCSFALGLLKMMNGGSYPEDFIERGETHAQSYVRNVVSKTGIARKHQAVIAAEKDFRRYWKARF